MPPATLLDLADDVTRIVGEIRSATATDGDRGRKVTLAELASILLAAGRLVGHVGTMIASGQHK